MSVGVFAIAILAALLAAAFVPLRLAFREHQLFASDLALPVLPAAGFALGLIQFNAPAQVGWALMGYPFLVVAVSVAVLYLSVFGLRKLVANARVVSFAVLAVASLAAFYVGATVAPWYE